VPEIDVFGGRDRIGLLDAGVERFATHPTVGWVSEGDAELEGELTGRGLRPSPEVMVAFVRPTTPREAAVSGGFVVRPLGGEAEADTRRAASHAAFGSTMDAGEHLARYLRFMRSPGYEPSRDLVAVAPDGAVVSFLIWWGDAATGIAQLEPVGTHPNHQRRGLGAAVFGAALRDMAAAGMHTVRVCTDASRADAVAFYESLGFLRDDVIRWWRPGGGA
jgi:ribosomal protein S18 acetylase RimI-like enzyme